MDVMWCQSSSHECVCDKIRKGHVNIIEEYNNKMVNYSDDLFINDTTRLNCVIGNRLMSFKIDLKLRNNKRKEVQVQCRYGQLF